MKRLVEFAIGVGTCTPEAKSSFKNAKTMKRHWMLGRLVALLSTAFVACAAEWAVRVPP
jgi:hypothetical protein